MIEREVKLALPGRFAIPTLTLDDAPLTLTAEPELTLRATYFDTRDLRLARLGATLLHRTGEPDGPMWTLKLPIGATGGGPDRTELHYPDPRRDPPPEARSLVTALVRREPLTAVATLRTRRRPVRLLQDDVAVAELFDDEVSVIERRRVVSRFRELEIEALIDDVDLGPLVDQLHAAGAAAAEPIPKVVRALGSRATGPSDFADVDLPDDSTMADILRVALAGTLARVVRHDPAARLGQPEAVHQLRVAFRRLHSDLRTLGDAVDPAWHARIEPELRAVVDALADARDLDVLIGGIRSDLDAGEAAALVPMLGALEARRTSAHAKLRVALDSAAYVDLLDELVEAVTSPPAGLAGPARAAVALPALTLGAWSRLDRRADGLGPDSPADEFHRVRIAAKRARYAVDLAARSLGGDTGSAAARLASKIAGLQDQLGALQDATVAEEAIRASLSAGAARAPVAFEAGRLVERQRIRAAAARAGFLEAWPRVRRRRWRKWAE